MQLEIVKWYNPVLEEIAEAVTEFTPELEALSTNMIETMNRFNGLGLSGNQVAAPIRIFVMKRELPKEGEPLTLTALNPRMLIEGPDEFMSEGCLSLPGIYEQVCRGSKVDMIYQDLQGKEQNIYLEGIEARIAQHELDHLNGIMFFNRMSRQLRRGVLKRWEKANR